MTFDSDIRHWPTLAAFVAHLQTVPRPTWCKRVTNHNTYIPNELQWRGIPSVESCRQTYIGKGWSAGPHLFLAADAPRAADRGIFQLTPIGHPGVHAGSCNADALGIENVGDFDARPPSAAQYQLMLDVNRAVLKHWMIPPSQVNVHRECMPGRTCPGKYLDPAKLRADLALPIRAPTTDPAWDLWGEAFPLAPEQRSWGIPQCWRANHTWLGAARSFEHYVDAKTSAQTFTGGYIIYEALAGMATAYHRKKDFV